MSLLWADGFDTYGSNAEMSLAGYSFVNSQISGGIQASAARTGAYGFRLNSAGDVGFRRILDATIPVCIAGIAIQMSSAPSGNLRQGINFERAAASSVIKVFPLPDLSLGVALSQGGAPIAQSDPNILEIGSYPYIEAKVIRGTNAADGSVEIRKNGDTILIVDGLSLGASDINAVLIGSSNSTTGIFDWNVDDYYICDNAGLKNNDFLGDRRMDTSFVNLDELIEWALSSGVNAWELLNNVPASDLDYIEALNIADIAEFGVSNVAIDTNDIAAVVMMVRALKTDAGVSTVSLGAHTGAVVDNGAPVDPTTAANVIRRILETDPNGVAWTKANRNATTFRVTRES